MNREIYPGGLYPLIGDVESQAGDNSVKVTGLQGIPLVNTPPDDRQVIQRWKSGWSIIQRACFKDI